MSLFSVLTTGSGSDLPPSSSAPRRKVRVSRLMGIRLSFDRPCFAAGPSGPRRSRNLPNRFGYGNSRAHLELICFVARFRPAMKPRLWGFPGRYRYFPRALSWRTYSSHRLVSSVEFSMLQPILSVRRLLYDSFRRTAPPLYWLTCISGLRLFLFP